MDTVGNLLEHSLRITIIGIYSYTTMSFNYYFNIFPTSEDCLSKPKIGLDTQRGDTSFCSAILNAPCMKLGELKMNKETHFGSFATCSYQTLYRARKKILQTASMSFEDSFKYLYSAASLTKQLNPLFHFDIKVSQDEIFEKFFLLCPISRMC